MAALVRDSKRDGDIAMARSPLPNADPAHKARILAEASALIRQGQRDKAVRSLSDAAKSWPADAEIQFELAAMLHEAGARDKAEAHYRQALTAQPDHVGAITNLGSILIEAGRHDEADRVLSAALASPAKAGKALETLVALRNTLGRDAGEVWAAIATADPLNSEAWTRLAASVRGRSPDEAVKYFGRALAAQPYSASTHHNLGVGFLEIGRLREAVEAFKNALALAPDYADAMLGLANAIDGTNTSQDPTLALECIEIYKKAEKLAPDSVSCQVNLINAYKRLGLLDEARQCCRRAAALVGPSGFSVREILMAPRVFPSTDAMAEYRRNLWAGLDRLQATGIVITDPVQSVQETGFGLAYHNLNDLDLQRRLADFYRATVPGLEFVAPHCRTPRAGKKKGQKIRLGIVGSYLHNRTMDNLNVGLIRNLSRERFDLVLFRPGGFADGASDAVDRLVEKVCYLSNELEGAREAVAAEELDALFYFEIGMVPLTYYMAFSRLAPVQCVTWGHPDTTGIPAMDYFLSSRLLEPDGAEQYYSERLIRLQHLPTCYPKPPIEAVVEDRGRLGLPTSARIYLCPQNLMKIHPDFDRALGRILTEDPDGRLLITTSALQVSKPALERRIAEQFPAVADRIIFLPPMGRLDFMNLLKVADANLDPFYFSGGNSTHEALALGSPVVTWPGPFMRGRVTLGLYQRMGLDELICTDPDDYVRKALRLARDTAWRDRLRATIKERSAILFDNLAMVREFEDFIETAVAAAARKELLTEWNHV